jgi:hypothetical protein
MPRILQRPHEEQTITLPCESGKPEADRIQWRVRALTRGETIDYEEAFVAAAILPTAEQVHGRKAVEAAPATEDTPAAPAVAAVPGLADVIRRVAVGWSNIVDDKGQPVPFNDEAFDVFTPQELITIARELPDAAGWGDLKSKKKQP